MVSKAFDDLSAASQPLLDDLALAERAQGKTVAEDKARDHAKGTASAAKGSQKPANGGTDSAKATKVRRTSSDPCPNIVMMGGDPDGSPEVQYGFCNQDSYYYSELVDPPATRAFRRALAVVGNYTKLLLMLAEGRNVDEAKGQLNALASNLSSALEAVGVGGAVAVSRTALEALSPLIDLAAKDANAEELERVVRQESPKVIALLEALRAGAPEFFMTLTEVSFAKFSAEGGGNAELAAAEAGRIEAYRVAVSNYVVLLDQYQRLLQELVAAYKRPSPSLAHLAEQSADLSARADAWRRTLASLRTGLR